ncbi:MAG: hypothetical protein BroJett025_00220 [Patescibacteria group bacterium]|nr:MAG: hypothetical protein BroJett025_00220 [Patescibacteria group bacterium]
MANVLVNRYFTRLTFRFIITIFCEKNRKELQRYELEIILTPEGGTAFYFDNHRLKSPFCLLSTSVPEDKGGFFGVFEANGVVLN